MRERRGGFKLSMLLVALVGALISGLFLAAAPAQAETRLGDINSRFTIYPNESEGGTLTGNNLKIEPVKDGGGVSVTVNIDLSTSGSDPAKPGELELLIPRTIFEVRDMSHAKVDIPYPADGSGDWKYTFVDENGNQVSENSSSCTHIKLVNNISIEPAHTQSMAIAYSVALSSMIKDESNVDFEPKLTLKKGEEETSKTPTKLNVQVDTHIEIADANKSTYNSYVTDQWLDAWGPKPDWYTDDKVGKYFFLMWEVRAALEYSSATQPYKLTYAEPNPVPDGGIICGYMDWYSNNTGSGSRDDAETTARLLSEPPVKEVLPRVTPGYSPSGVTKDAWYSGVLVAYPKPTTTPKEYTNTIKATVKPYDGHDPDSSLDAEGTFTYKDLALNTPTGDMYYLEKLKGWIANGPDYRRLWGGIDRILAGVPVDDIAYSISGYAYQYTYDADPDYNPTIEDPSRNGRLIRSWGAEYTAELVDDMFFLNVDPNCRLGDGDMEITRINPYWEAYEYHPNMASGGYVEVEVDYTVAGESGAVNGSWAKNYPELIAYGKSDNGSWQKIATFAINTEGRGEVKEIHLDGASYYNDETHRGGVKIPKDTGFTQIKYSVTANEGKSVEDNKDVIRIRFARRWTPGGEYHSYDSTDKCELYLTLYPTDKVKAAVQAAVDNNVASDKIPEDGTTQDKSHSYNGDLGEGDDFAPVAKLHNIDHIAVYTGIDSEQAKRSDMKGAFLTGPETDPNFADVLNQHDADLYGTGTYMWHKKAQIELTKYKSDSAIIKSSEYENDPGNYRVIVHYTSQALEATITHDTDVPQELVDLGIIPLQQSGTFYDLLPQGMTVDTSSITAEACAADAAVEVEFETIANYEGSGRTLLIVRTSTDAANWRTATAWKNGLTNPAENSLPHIESGFIIHYDGYYDWESLEDYGNTVTNYIGYESSNDEIKNGVDDDASQWQYANFLPVEDYFKDLDETEPEYDEDGNEIPRNNFLYTNDTTTLVVVTQARYGLTKKISSNTVSTWTNGRIIDGDDKQVGVPTGGQYQYRLRFASEPATTVKNMVLFDGLEAYEYIRDKKATDDSGVVLDPAQPKSDAIDVDRDGYEVVTWQGTFESIDVSKIEAMGAKADLYYTTKDRKELAVDDQSDGSDTLADPADPAGSALADCWTGPLTAVELNGLDDDTKASITGLAIDMRKKKNGTDDFELDSGKSVAAIVTMRAPSDPTLVRELVKSAQDQYDAASDDDKSITNDKPYTYNAVNMNSSVRQKNSSAYSEAHLITYEYTRAYLYVPLGNISIEKKVTGLTEDMDPQDFEFKVSAVHDGGMLAAQYRRIDTMTGYYFTETSESDGVYVNMSNTEVGPFYTKFDEEAEEWKPFDPESGEFVSEPADAKVVVQDESGNEDPDLVEDVYTFDAPEDGLYAVKDGQRIVLLDVEADIEWVVNELEDSAQGFDTTNTVNAQTVNGESENPRSTAPFIIGDKNTARIVFTNEAIGELTIEKDVTIGDEDKLFDFVVTITDTEGNEFMTTPAPTADNPDPAAEPRSFKYVGGADEGVDAPEDGELKSGDTIQLKKGQRITITVPVNTKYTIEEIVPENYEEPTHISTTGDEVGEEVSGASVDGEMEFQKPQTETFINTHKPDNPPKKNVYGNDSEGDDLDKAREGADTNPSEPDITNGDATHVDLGLYANPITYTITQEVPIETKKLVLTDTLEDVLEFVSTADDVIVLDGNGNEIDNDELDVEVTIDGQTLTVTVQFADPQVYDDEGNVVGVKNNLEELLGGEIEVVFVAQVVEGADLSPYMVDPNESDNASDSDASDQDASGSDASTSESESFETESGEEESSKASVILIPNTAKIQINNRPEVESEPVTVTPPPPNFIEKKVMGAEHYNLKSGGEIYSYSVDVWVPLDAEELQITDTLEPVLDFATPASEVVLHDQDGTALTSAQAAISGKTLTVNIEGDEVVDNRGTFITLEFKAKVASGANLSRYVVNGTILIPNTAKYMINNDANRVYRSNTVTVTPPKPMPATGDNTSLIAMGALVLLGAALLATGFVLRKERPIL